MKNSYDFHRNDVPICPWCNHRLDDYWDLSGLKCEDGFIYEYQCGSCDKLYNIEVDVSVKFSTVAQGCEKHKLKLQSFTDTLYECTECHNEFYDWQFPDGKYPKLKDGQYEIVGKAPTQKPVSDTSLTTEE